MLNFSCIQSLWIWLKYMTSYMTHIYVMCYIRDITHNLPVYTPVINSAGASGPYGKYEDKIQTFLKLLCMKLKHAFMIINLWRSIIISNMNFHNMAMPMSSHKNTSLLNNPLTIQKAVYYCIIYDELCPPSFFIWSKFSMGGWLPKCN